jgi:hypothetical protein
MIVKYVMQTLGESEPHRLDHGVAGQSPVRLSYGHVRMQV